MPKKSVDGSYLLACFAGFAVSGICLLVAACSGIEMSDLDQDIQRVRPKLDAIDNYLRIKEFEE